MQYKNGKRLEGSSIDPSISENESESGIRQAGQIRIFPQLSSFPTQSKQTILNNMWTLKIEEAPLITPLLSIFPSFNLR